MTIASIFSSASRASIHYVQKGRIDLDLLRQVAARFGRETSDELEKLIGER